MDRNEAFEVELQDTALASKNISHDISLLITEFQFLDKVKQNIGKIIETMDVLSKLSGGLHKEGEKTLDFQANSVGDDNQKWFEDVVGSCVLGETRADFISKILMGASYEEALEEEEQELDEEDDFDLF